MIASSYLSSTLQTRDVPSLSIGPVMMGPILIERLEDFTAIKRRYYHGSQLLSIAEVGLTGRGLLDRHSDRDSIYGIVL